jgi:hypothetical protein
MRSNHKIVFGEFRLSREHRRKDVIKEDRGVKDTGKGSSDMISVLALARSSSLIFTGTVVQRHASTVPMVSPHETLVVVTVDRGLLVDPVLGDLRNKMITVAAPRPEIHNIGQKAVFFTNSWIHGRGLAVREVGFLDIAEEDNVARAVGQLPQFHLLDRLRSAELVVAAEVARVRQVEKRSRERAVAMWAVADLKVNKVLRGKVLDQLFVYFPTAKWPPWTKAPRFKEHQKGIFMLHAPSRKATLSEATLETGSLVALDPADFQLELNLEEVETLLKEIK